MSDTTKSLRPLVSRPACWESEHEAIITFFTDDGDVWGFPFFGLLAAQVHGSESHAGAAVARRSSANPRAACARLLHSIRERERDRHQSERCGYPFGAADPASRLLPCPLAASALIMTSIAAGQAETLRLNLGDVIGSGTLRARAGELETEFQSRRLGFCHQTPIRTRVRQGR